MILRKPQSDTSIFDYCTLWRIKVEGVGGCSVKCINISMVVARRAGNGIRYDRSVLSDGSGFLALVGKF